jgi:hypothetical protein
MIYNIDIIGGPMIYNIDIAGWAYIPFKRLCIILLEMADRTNIDITGLANLS